MLPLFYIYDIGRRAFNKLMRILDRLFLRILLANPRITCGKNPLSFGLPKIRIAPKGRMTIGDDFRIHDGRIYNLAGRDQQCVFNIKDDAHVVIGNNVGMSSVTIVSRASVVIGDNTIIGNNTVLSDSDAHSIYASERLLRPDPGVKIKEIRIGSNVFVGGHSTILKGVTIGDNSVIGAGSIVSKNVPANEIWAGCPARFIKKIDPLD
jgi:acetyltransferase-like isoleucine patch superfamily enzyme